MGGQVDNPRVSISLLSETQIQEITARNDCIVGQIGTDGSATNKALYQNVQDLNNQEIKKEYQSRS